MRWFQKLIGITVPTAEEWEISEINKYKQQEKEANELIKAQPNSPIGSLRFVFCKDGGIVVECEWINKDDETAKAYGNFLYHTNEGAFKTIIGQTLMEYAKNNICTVDFIESIMNAWAKTVQEEDDKPIVNASNVLRMGKQEE